MTAWTSEELSKIGNAEELQIASLRADGTLRKPVTIATRNTLPQWWSIGREPPPFGSYLAKAKGATLWISSLHLLRLCDCPAFHIKAFFVCLTHREGLTRKSTVQDHRLEQLAFVHPW